MAQMSKELMDLINSVPCCYWATASKDGVPDVAPVGTTGAVSPDTIVAASIFMGKTLDNLRENPTAAIVVNSVPPEVLKKNMSAQKYGQVTGAQIKGSVTLLTSGDTYDKMKNMVAQALGEEVAQAVNTTVVLKVEEVYSLSGAGPSKQIA